MPDDTYSMEYTGQQLDEALDKVTDDYADVSSVTAIPSDVRAGVTFVDHNRALQVGTATQGGGTSWYGVCSTSGDTATKNILIEGFPISYTDGLSLCVLFTNTQQATGNVTLSINGNPAVSLNSDLNTGVGINAWKSGEVIEFVYDSTANSNSGAFIVVTGGSNSSSSGNINNIESQKGVAVSVTDGMFDQQVDNVRVYVNLYQTRSSGGSTIPSPNNIRPITIRRTPYYHYAVGKNLLVKHNEEERTVTGTGGDTGSVTFHFNSDGSVTVTGSTDTQTISILYLYQSWVKHIPVGIPVIVSGGTDNVYVHLRSENAAGQSATEAQSTQGNEVTHSFPSGLRSTYVRLAIPQGKSNINETVYPMVRLASDDDSTWESPSGHFYSVGITDGIYGGYVDFKSNTAISTYDRFVYDGTEDSWSVSDTNVETLKAFSIPITGLKYYDNTADNLDGMCNMFDKGSVNISNVGENTWWYYYDGANTSLTFIWSPTGTGNNDLAKWKSFLGEKYVNSTPLEVCLPLSTPVSTNNVTIPSLPILSDNYNTYWFDAGDIEIFYPLDLVKYINKVTDTSDIKSNLIDYNSYDVLTGKEFNDGTYTDIEFTWTGHTCYVNGTTTKTRVNNILGSNSSPYLPEEIIPGNTYFVKYHGENVYIQVLVWTEGGGSTSTTIARIYNDQAVTIPPHATAACFRLTVPGTSSVPVTVNEEYVSVAILNAESNKGLFDALTNQDSRYAWQKPDFLIHIPQEETKDMISVVYDYIGKTLSSTSEWTEGTEVSNPGTSTYKYDRIISSFDIYDMWDELQSRYPYYIDEGEVIGYSLDIPDAETGIQPNYRAIKAYYIHPKSTYVKGGKTYSINYSDMPTVYLTAGTHGGESTPTWNLFSIFRRALLTDTIYSDLLHSVCFRVIPCLDCWSYDHFTRYLAAAYTGYNSSGELVEASGINEDDYDGNRQCICPSSLSISYDNLILHEYATEAEALTNYLNECGFGSIYGDCYVDLHNNSDSLGYLTTGREDISHLYNTMMDTLAKDWLANTTWSNGNPADYYSSSTGSASQLSGNILAHSSEATSYAWFFENAYNCFSSNILEVQQSGPGAGNEYAIAKGLDMTYRWFKTLYNNINHDGQDGSMADFYVEETVEGNPIFFGDKWSLVDDIKIPIDYVQIGEGDPSLSNPRTIYTCREIIVSSKNILSPINTTVDGDTTFTANEDGSITIDSGGVAAAANRSKIIPDNGDGNRRFRIPTDTYLYLSGSAPNIRIEVCYSLDKPDDTGVRYLRTTTAGKTASGTIVTNADLDTESQYSAGGYPYITGGYFILPSQVLVEGEYYNVTRAYLKIVIKSGLIYDNVTVYPMLQPVPAPNQGASLVFEKGPPQVSILSLFNSLPYTSGFGIYDYISGDFNVDKLLITFDGSLDEDWQIYEGTTKSGLICFQLQVNMPLVSWSNISEFKGISNIFKVGNGNVSSSSAAANTWWYTRNAGASTSGMGYYNFIMSSSDVSTISAWRSWLNTNHTQIVVPLDAPITYNLTEKKDSVQINLDRLITRFSFGAYDYYVWDKKFSAHAWVSSARGREITPGTPIISPIVDNTLSIYGQAADAKVVGDELADLQWGNGKTIECFTADDTTSRATTFDGVIALYDELVSKYPSYVTKNALSYNSTTLYEYVFTTGAYNDYVVSGTLRDENPKIIKPVILMTAGVHGNEQASVMGLYDFIKNLCKNNFKLMSIRDGITLKVVPIVTPSGYNQNTRTNVNSVNINRNFDANWSSEAIGGAGNNPGQSAADQDETQIVQAWLQNNKDALLYIDSHNSSGDNEVSFFLGNQETASIAVKNMYLKAMDKIIPYWERVRKIPSSVRFALTGGFNPGNFTIGGSATEYGRSQGILSFTIETNWNINETGLCSNYTIGVVSEALANLLIEIVSSLKLTGNSFTTDNDVSILVFGTSFTYSTLGYVPRIFRDICPEINPTLGFLYRSGASIQDHIDLFNADAAYTEYSEYDFCSQKWINVNNSITAKSALTMRKWDYICIQQGWKATAADLNTLCELIINYVDYPFSFLINMPQAIGANGTFPDEFTQSTGEEKSDAMFGYIAQHSEDAKDSFFISDVLPSATAVQNARHIDSLKSIGTYGYLCDDTLGHLQNGLGPLVSGYAASYKLLELMGKKSKLYCQTWNPTDADIGSNSYNLWTATSHGSCVGVTDENKLLAQKCALAAIKDPFNITVIPVNTIVISAQPSSASVASGTSVTFSVTATGDNISYRWQRSSDGVTWMDVSGTSSSFTFTASSSFNNRKYRCKVYNDYFEAFSEAATLIVT